MATIHTTGMPAIRFKEETFNPRRRRGSNSEVVFWQVR